MILPVFYEVIMRMEFKLVQVSRHFASPFSEYFAEQGNLKDIFLYSATWPSMPKNPNKS